MGPPNYQETKQLERFKPTTCHPSHRTALCQRYGFSRVGGGPQDHVEINELSSRTSPGEALAGLATSQCTTCVQCNYIQTCVIKVFWQPSVCFMWHLTR